MISLKELSIAHIPQVITLSLNIFKPSNPQDKYLNPKVWEEYFQRNGIIIAAYEGEKIVGYVFLYRRDHNLTSLHCWMAGVDEEHRGKGILKLMINEALKKLKELNISYLTINTYPEKFPAMYAFLMKYNFDLMKEEEYSFDGKKTKKSFFRRKIV